MTEKPGCSAPSEHDAAKAEAVRDALISWFRENGRDLPWRRTRDPYHVLVSEVMLQQIQVARAVPFYLAFLERFPTIEALAEAPIADAIRVWGDLGRYKRVVNLHRTARIVVEEFGGELPSDPETLVKLPGIGHYTAGAVACFAFERDVPFVDTNMRRVLHRLFFGVDVPAPSASDGEILRIAADLVSPGQGWEWNSALMELGALVCTARKPRCDSCPLSDDCRARPEIADALAKAPREAKKETGYKYEDSNRYYRGRVLAKLRDAEEGGVPLRDLGLGLREGFADHDVSWLYGVVQSLEKDGLAVAEDKPAYGTGGGDKDDEGDEPRETRVRLP